MHSFGSYCKDVHFILDSCQSLAQGRAQWRDFVNLIISI